ncbi:hypothetical protein QR46_1332 [Giardia duodenalis assemblage B]|uniref:Secreted protein n=1 Tax=Giardia duodenalis assemblage B TaxID=1394984 RepID=A0A132NX75_GIAIN|nr:hypothetical protein QR46_1332 [Giardia intestinalis assemblage B]
MRVLISLLLLVEADPSCLTFLSINFCCSGRSSSNTGSVRKTFCMVFAILRASVLLFWACSLVHRALFFVGVAGTDSGEPTEPGLLGRNTNETGVGLGSIISFRPVSVNFGSVTPISAKNSSGSIVALPLECLNVSPIECSLKWVMSVLCMSPRRGLFRADGDRSLQRAPVRENGFTGLSNASESIRISGLVFIMVEMLGQIDERRHRSIRSWAGKCTVSSDSKATCTPLIYLIILHKLEKLVTNGVTIRLREKWNSVRI